MKLPKKYEEHMAFQQVVDPNMTLPVRNLRSKLYSIDTASTHLSGVIKTCQNQHLSNISEMNLANPTSYNSIQTTEIEKIRGGFDKIGSRLNEYMERKMIQDVLASTN